MKRIVVLSAGKVSGEIKNKLFERCPRNIEVTCSINCSASPSDLLHSLLRDISNVIFTNSCHTHKSAVWTLFQIK